MNYRNSIAGTITTNGASVTLPYRHFVNGGVGVQITGTFTATLQFEVTINGTDWVAFQVTNVNTGSSVTTATAAGIFKGDVVGIVGVRITSTAFSSGTANIWIAGLAG